MLNQQIIADAEAHLNQRRANVAAIEFRDPLLREFSTQQIRDSVPEQALKPWLEEGLPGNIQLPALYVIEVDEQDVADQLKNSFDAARADKNRGYVLPMRNDAVDGSTVLYVGSSRKIRQRLKRYARAHPSHHAAWSGGADRRALQAARTAQSTPVLHPSNRLGWRAGPRLYSTRVILVHGMVILHLP